MSYDLNKPLIIQGSVLANQTLYPPIPPTPYPFKSLTYVVYGITGSSGTFLLEYLLPDGSTIEIESLSSISTAQMKDLHLYPYDKIQLKISAGAGASFKFKLFFFFKTFFDKDAVHISIVSEIYGLTEKSSPVDDDILILEDSEASYAKKKVKLSSLASGLSGTVIEIPITFFASASADHNNGFCKINGSNDDYVRCFFKAVDGLVDDSENIVLRFWFEPQATDQYTYCRRYLGAMGYLSSDVLNNIDSGTYVNLDCTAGVHRTYARTITTANYDLGDLCTFALRIYEDTREFWVYSATAQFTVA